MKQQEVEEHVEQNDSKSEQTERRQRYGAGPIVAKRKRIQRARLRKPMFLPDIAELEVLAEHYVSFLLAEEVAFWQLQSICLGEVNVIGHASRRLEGLRNTLGNAVVDRIWQTAEQNMVERLGQDSWQEFCDWRAEDTAEFQQVQSCPADVREECDLPDLRDASVASD